MNIYDFAMQMEKEGEALYKRFAQDAPYKGLAHIFTELAKQEHKHYQTFKKMKDFVLPEESDSPFLDDVITVFEEFRRERSKFNFNVSQTDMYRKALDIEKQSIDFYLEKATEVEDSKHKAIFEKIAKEEKSHFKIIENIIEFITAPDTWLEQAEFSKIKEQY